METKFLVSKDDGRCDDISNEDIQGAGYFKDDLPIELQRTLVNSGKFETSPSLCIQEDFHDYEKG